MPVPIHPGMISPHGASSDGSDRQAHSSDAASTESSSSDIDEPLENEYVGNQESYDETLGLDAVTNVQSEPEILEADSDCPHLRAKLSDPSFVQSYSGAVAWRARSQMQCSTDARSKAKRSKTSIVRCFSCGIALPRPCVCVECSVGGCLLPGHIGEHLRASGHGFFVDLTSGSVFCSECDDFVYSNRLDQAYDLALLAAEEQVARFKVSSSPRQQFRPWAPSSQTASELAKATQVQCSGLRGLFNLGSTCYLNVIVQTMVHNPLVRNYYMSDKHNSQLCATKDCMSCEMDRLFTKIYASDLGPFGPTSILHCLWLNSTELANYAQHDAHEFFISMLNQIHATTPGSTATNCTCLVHSTFAGLLQSDVQCGLCQNVTSRSDMMLDISLDLKPIAQASSAGSAEMTLVSCLKRFTQPEKTTYKCDKCGKSSNDATKQLSIRKLPPVLCFQLKRFEHGATSSNKIDTDVRFGATLNMAPFSSVVASKAPSKDRGPDSMYEYDLLAVVNHEGQMDTGHYTNFARCHDRWYRFDDEKVTRSTLQACLQSSAYMLVYVKRHLNYRASPDEAFVPEDGELPADIMVTDSMLMDFSATQDEELLQLLGDH